MTINPASSPCLPHTQLQTLPSVPDKSAQDRFDALLNSDPSNARGEQSKKLNPSVDRSGTVGEPLKTLSGVMSDLQAKLYALQPGGNQHPPSVLPSPAIKNKPA